MNPFPLPVRTTGAGSQPEEEPVQFLDMPRDMSTYSMPCVPDGAPPAALTVARDVLAQFLGLLERWDPAARSPGPRLDFASLPAEAVSVLNQMLGEGEVAIQVSGAQPLSIQESVFTGVWRVCAVDASRALVADWLEAAPIPDVVLAAARAAAGARIEPVSIPHGAMNSPALLAEITAQLGTRKLGDPAHVLNLTLFPMTAGDHDVLLRALPVGPVAMMSRGFGNCRITSTGARDVWRVQYFNSMSTLILDTIEVVDVPEVALAAVEDLLDSRTRLAELIEWMSESCPA
jgi:hydrogenase-1 operon protein HyaF